jgi:VanZ family protein
MIRKDVREKIDVNSNMLFIFLSADLEKKEEKVQPASRIENNLYGNSFIEEADAMIDEVIIQHFILGMMMALSYPTFKRFKYPYLGLILIHPFLIEGVQFFMPDRTPDTADVLVGLVGTLLGFCLV